MIRQSLFLKLIILFLLLAGTGIREIYSQVMISPTGKPASLVICQGDGTFSLLIANITGGTMSGATLLIDLPAGCIYT
ncbi:MAG: hypothetical protein D4R67_05630, partial [Bacteroidetes bacterium]